VSCFPLMEEQRATKRRRIDEDTQKGILLDLPDELLMHIVSYVAGDPVQRMKAIVDNFQLSRVCKHLHRLSDGSCRANGTHLIQGRLSTDYALGERCLTCGVDALCPHKYLWRSGDWMCLGCIRRRKRDKRHRRCHATGLHDLQPDGCICADSVYKCLGCFDARIMDAQKIPAGGGILASVVIIFKKKKVS